MTGLCAPYFAVPHFSLRHRNQSLLPVLHAIHAAVHHHLFGDCHLTSLVDLRIHHFRRLRLIWPTQPIEIKKVPGDDLFGHHVECLNCAAKVVNVEFSDEPFLVRLRDGLFALICSSTGAKQASHSGANRQNAGWLRSLVRAVESTVTVFQGNPND